MNDLPTREEVKAATERGDWPNGVPAIVNAYANCELMSRAEWAVTINHEAAFLAQPFASLSRDEIRVVVDAALGREEQ